MYSLILQQELEPLGELILEDGSMFQFDLQNVILPNEILLDANITLSEVEADAEVTLSLAIYLLASTIGMNLLILVDDL